MKRYLITVNAAVVVVVAILLVGILAGFGSGAPASSDKIRPIEDFLTAQKNLCAAIDFKTMCFAAVDYAGLWNKQIEEQSGGSISLGTKIEGKILEQPLPDGRAKVTVQLHSTNSLAWVTEAEWDDNGNLVGDLLFGNFWESVVFAGAEPALGEWFLKWVFINKAPGAPMPDLLAAAMDPEMVEWISVSVVAHADGVLQAAFGVPDGTPGHLQITQESPFAAGKGATADGWPVENIKLKVVGKGK